MEIVSMHFFSSISWKTSIYAIIRNTLQRDSTSKPRVGTKELPWVLSGQVSNSNGVAPLLQSHKYRSSHSIRCFRKRARNSS
jgi:hypothetical protein